MYRFQHQEYFVMLILVGLAILLFVLFQIWRKRKINLLGKEDLVNDLMPSYSSFLNKTKFVLLAMALLFGVLSLTNLQKRGKFEKVTQKGIDIMIALDISNSMYAQDLKPNRLEKAKLFASKLVDQLSGNRIGLVLFAGRSYLSVPLTSDLQALKMNVSIANPEIAPSQGTVMGDALQMVYQSFNSKNAKHKAVVLISDGEDHEDKAIAEARKIGKKGIMLCTVGVGSENGSTIRLPDGSIKKDGEGNEVISKMNEEELNKIAEAGQGLFVNLNSVESSVGQVANRLKQISKTNLGESQLANYSSFFQYFLIVMLLFLLIEFFTPAKKSKKRLRSAFQVFTFLLLPQFLVAQTTDKNIYRGNELYKKQEFQKAATAYQKSLAEKKSKTKEPAQFNLGNALLRAKDPEQALKQYEYVGTKTKNPKMSSYAFHNAGNVRATQKKWQEAINYYKASLKKNPKAQQTKYNLAYAQQKLKEQQDQQKKDKQDQQDKQEEDKDQKEQPNKPEDEKEDQNKDEQQDQNKQKPKPQPSKLSEQQAKKILDALNREEKKLKDNKQKEKGRVYHLDKDW